MKLCPYIEQNDDGGDEIMPTPTEIKLKELKARQQAATFADVIKLIIEIIVAVGIIWLLGNIL